MEAKKQDMSPTTLHVPRLFVPYGSTITVDEYGLPVFPSEFYTSVAQAEWEKWQDDECIVLLGEPGIGKSTEFEFHHRKLKSRGQYSFLFKIKDFYSGCTLDELLPSDEIEYWKEWKNSDNSFAHVFLDSLDEARLDYEPVLKELTRQIKTALPIKRLKLCLSCRIRDWKNITDETVLKRLFPDKTSNIAEKKNGITVLELLGLHQQAIAEIAKSSIIDADNFFERAIEFRVIQLCSHPLLLRFLLDEFKETKNIAATKTEIYSKAIKRAFAEDNPVHGEAKKTTTPLLCQGIASKIAFLSIISGLDTLYVPDVDRPAKQNCIDCSLSEESKDVLLETLNTTIFTGAGVSEFRFNHRSLAEFLAADFLNKKLLEGMPFFQIRPMLFTIDSGIPTPLRGTVSWISAFNKTVRDECLKCDPLVVLEGDLASYDIESKEAIITTLADKFGERNWQRAVKDFGELASGCKVELLENLLSSDNSQAVRLMILDMIEQGNVRTLFDVVLNISLNENEDYYLRIRAASLIARKGSDEQKNSLRTILKQNIKNDPDDELSGIILYYLYPKFIATTEAIDSYHFPQNENLFGMYKKFWEDSFEKNISAADLEVVLRLFYQRIIEKDRDFWYDYENHFLPEIFSRLFSSYLSGAENIKIESIAPYLRVLSDSNSVRHVSDKKALENIERWLANRRDIKKELLLFSLNGNPPTEANKFSLWKNLPFSSDSLLPEDFEWLYQEAESCSDIWQKHAFFNLLCRAWAMSDFLPTERFEQIDAFVQKCEPCKDEWKHFLVRDIDSETQSWKKRQHERERQEKIAEEKSLQWIIQNIDEIKSGTPKLLIYLSNKMIKNSDIWHPKFSLIEDQFGSNIRFAAEEGYSRAWQNASIEGIEYLTGSGTIPPKIIMLSHALESEWDSKRIDWAIATEEQVEAATVIAIRYRNSFPAWFESLYREKPSIIKNIFNRFLSYETASDLPHPDLCRKLQYAEVLKEEFSQYVIDYLLSNKLPENLVALDVLLSVAIRKQDSKFLDYVKKRAQEDTYYAELNLDKNISVKMSFLAAWWYLDWRSAWKYLTDNMFMGSSKNNNLLIFVESISKICGKLGYHMTRWPYDMDVEAYIRLVPFLYESVPPEGDAERLGVHKVDERESIAQIRNDIVQHISTTEPSRSRKAFQEWVKNPLFKEHKDWFLSIIDNLERRIIDEQWQPVSADDAAKVVLRNSQFLRNSNDLFMLLSHIFDIEMRKALSEDTSLVPLLWEGIKKDGRTPKDEKPLQQVLANQLKHLLRGTKTIFAREPEVFDSKKPDFRVSAIIPELGNIHVAIEVKQAHAADIWTSPIEQLLEKYMKDIVTNYGIYLVGWYGEKIKPRPDTRETVINFAKLQKALQSYVDGKLSEENKKIAVFVYDVGV